MSDDVSTYDYPAPDCAYTAGEVAELLEHVNGQHSGEYQRDDWPDTPSGRDDRAGGDTDDDSVENGDQ